MRSLTVQAARRIAYMCGRYAQSLGAEEIAALKYDPQVAFTYAHTSGHATLDDLKSFAAAINPKVLVPIHTEFSEDYSDHFENVVNVEDDCPFELE
mgnify:CR=1 FL=1